MKFNKILEIPPYDIGNKKKDALSLLMHNQIISYHTKKSKIYKKILNLKGIKSQKFKKISDMPYLPVRLFKDFDLRSIEKKKIFKTLFSSGTSGKGKSKIYLDKYNSEIQFKILQKITKTILGKSRLPMLIIDKSLKNYNRNEFNAKIAAIKGFSVFGKDHTYLLNSDETIDYKSLNNFLKKYHKSKFLIFGFTSSIYDFLIKKIEKNKLLFDFQNSIILHGGGWKKLEKLNISNEKFKNELKKKFKINIIINYYGLIEQAGSIFIECKCGYFITSNYSDILVRNSDLKIVKDGDLGFLQLFSLLPSSYPGHIILTEDLGKIIKDKNCKCFNGGKRFKVFGRVKDAEIRGCSDI